MNNIWNWLKDSHRLQHLGLGAVYGLFASDWYCTLYGGIGVAGALELKDKLWGSKPDWIDFSLTVAGVAVGYGLRVLILKMIGL
jgi:hypothetical protein